MGGRGRRSCVATLGRGTLDDPGLPARATGSDPAAGAKLAGSLPERQASVGGTTAPAGRVDYIYRPWRLVIEADSRRFHWSWLDVQADHRRDLILMAAGYRIVRVNWHQLIAEPELFVAAVRAFLREVAA